MGKINPIRVYPEQRDELYHVTEVQKLVEKKKEKQSKKAQEIMEEAKGDA